MPKTIHGLTWNEVAARHRVNGWSKSIGDGWAEIMERLLTDLEALGWSRAPITRLEEKYGELCFEVASGKEWTSAMEDRVTEAERESDRTCSKCGRPGEEVIVRGWVHKLCPGCALANHPADSEGS